MPPNGLQRGTRHDLDAILDHYTDDFEMQSPYIRAVTGSESGILVGKDKVAPYWSKALARYPDLHFRLRSVLRGQHSVVLLYEGVRGLSAEVFFFNASGLIYRAHAHYLSEALPT